MDGAARAEKAVVYVISCRRPELLKIGVADDGRKRLRELQVGSPVELTLADTRPYAERADAVAVCEELYRCFAGRRVRGGWYRLTLEELRHGFGRRATVEAPERARAAKAAEAAAEESRLARLREKRLGRRTEKQLAYERRRRQERTRMQKQAAKLLGEGLTQEQAAAAVGVTSRTLRNWQTAPAFSRELERAHQRRQLRLASCVLRLGLASWSCVLREVRKRRLLFLEKTGLRFSGGRNLEPEPLGRATALEIVLVLPALSRFGGTATRSVYGTNVAQPPAGRQTPSVLAPRPRRARHGHALRR